MFLFKRTIRKIIDLRIAEIERLQHLHSGSVYAIQNLKGLKKDLECDKIMKKWTNITTKSGTIYSVSETVQEIVGMIDSFVEPRSLLALSKYDEYNYRKTEMYIYLYASELESIEEQSYK